MLRDAAVGLALCARSRLDARLHFLYDLFHAHGGGYGGAHVKSDEEWGGKLMSKYELVFLAWSTLRALSALTHGNPDHVPTQMVELRHAVTHVVKSFESGHRGFDHTHGFSWAEIEGLFHGFVFRGAAWLYGLLDEPGGHDARLSLRRIVPRGLHHVVPPVPRLHAASG